MASTESQSTNNESVSLGSLLKVLRGRKVWVVLPVAIAVGLALVYSLVLTEPLYVSTASILRQTTNFDEALFNTQLFDLRDAQRYLMTGSRLIKLDAVAEEVQAELDSRRGVGSLLSMVSVKPQPDADIINISATSTDPEEAEAVANSFARQFILYRQAADRAALSQARAQVEQQLSGMSSVELESERGRVLSQKSEELRILETMQTGGFEIVQEAQVPSSPFSPRPVRTTFIALVGGLMLGTLLAFVVDRADRRVKTQDSLEREYALPVLATIPRSRVQLSTNGNKPINGGARFLDTSPAFVESFRALRSNVKYFEFDRQIRTIVVTSGLPQEGKTIVTINLAVSLALSGATVGVIEADLRRPMIHRYLGLSASVGVSSVLTGTHSLTKAIQLLKTGSDTPWNRQGSNQSGRAGRLDRNLFCLTSGPLPPNPAELIGSQQMKTLIEDVASLADYVLIDTPPVLVVSDALNLVNLVDAVIVCARLNRTTIEEAREVRTLLQRTGARTLGVVASGNKASSRRQGDPYGYYVADRPTNTGPAKKTH